MSEPLTALFLRHLPPSAEALPPAAELERQLGEALQRGQAALPGSRTDAAAFLPFLARRAAASLQAGGALLDVQVADLYLLCGYVRGDAVASERFTQRYLPQVEAALRRTGVPEAQVADLRQFALQQVLIEPAADGGGGYAGRGSLLGWMCVTAVRRAQTLLGRAGRELPLGVDLAERLTSKEADPEGAYFQRVYGAEFQAALREALASLSPRERTLLRLHYVDGLTTDQIGSLYHAHRTSAGRWVAQANARVRRRARAALLRRIQVRRSELSSILRLIRSQIEISLVNLLKA